jgi:hypothetical protein
MNQARIAAAFSMNTICAPVMFPTTADISAATELQQVGDSTR